MDEFNLISMNEEEFKAARKEYDDYVQKHFRYFHYRDWHKVARKPCLYRYPVGEAARKYYEGVLKRVRKYKVPTETIIQDINQLKTIYGDKWEEQFPQEGIAEKNNHCM